MGKIPIKLKPLKTLSYWRYVRLRKCFLSGAFPSAVDAPATIPTQRSRAQIVGNVLHLVVEKLPNIISSDDASPALLRDHFNQIVDKLSAELRNDPSLLHFGDLRSWPEISDTYRRIRQVLALRTAVQSSSTGRMLTEKSLHSTDGLLVGQLDALFVSDEKISVIDYKSGSLKTEEGLKDEYVEQLLFYAFLVEETFGRYPAELTLIGKDFESVEIEPSPERSRDLATAMKQTLSQYNKLANSTAQNLDEITSPNAENCLFCQAKPVCEAFWSSLQSFDLPLWAQAVVGTQAAPFQRSRGGTFSLELAVEKSSIPARTVKITRIGATRFPELNDIPGQRIIATSIKPVGAEKPGLTEVTDWTVIVSLDPEHAKIS